MKHNGGWSRWVLGLTLVFSGVACSSGAATVASVAFCADNADCTEPGLPNCNPRTAQCVGNCPDVPCEPEQPNCFSGLCQPKCNGASDCQPNLPNCNTGDGACFAQCANNSDCVDPANPECDPTTGLCLGGCPDRACAATAPNCGPDGICFGACAGNAECVNPALPNCDASTGLCQAKCPTAACPAALPNCGSDGVCFGVCASNTDCTDPETPNCDGATGLCQGKCPATACPAGLPNCTSAGTCFGACTISADCIDPAAPNCDPATGLCAAQCTSNSNCPDASLPNCGAGGICVGPCTSHAGCTLASAPNCELDPAAADVGLCGPACAGNVDCTSAAFPNCDSTTGQCLAPCVSAADCPTNASKCDTATGLCFAPECLADSACSPPSTVCEAFKCVTGCASHADCPASERCDLVDSSNLNHCEPRDCTSDADCATGQVCDTDGLVTPTGGGYCVAGCKSDYDCGQLGYDCDTSTGRCSPHDYGDIGQSCTGGCKSGFCLTGSGNVCTAFCCTQNDCPAGWGCRLADDGSGATGHTVSVCTPLATTQGLAQYGKACSADADCRSNICRSGQCRETCCTDANCATPFATGMACSLGGATNPSACLPAPTTGTDPMGALGCSTSGSAADCRSRMCFTFYQPDTGCTSNTSCPAIRPVCWDYPVGGTANGVGDCVRDMCVDNCCTESDCPSSGSDKYYCGKVTYGAGDEDVCLYHFGTATLAEGAACTSDGQCVSNFCSPTAHVCRHRCCTDADCTSSTAPRCALEQLNVLGVPRLVNVCQP